MDPHDVTFTIGIILAAGLVAMPLAQRLRLPHMLVMLGLLDSR